MLNKCNANHSIFCAIGQTIKGVKPLLEEQFNTENIGINLPQFIILNILFSHENVILEDLSKQLHTDKSAILRHIQYLETMFLVTKMKDKLDKRKKVLMLTQKGIETLTQARVIEQKIQALLIKDVDEDSLKIFRNVLNSIKEQSTLIGMNFN